MPQKLTVAVTGLNAVDNPGPGVPVIRAIREGAGFEGRIVGLAYNALDPGVYMDGICDDVYLSPYPSEGSRAMLARIEEIHAKVPLDVILPTLDSELSAFLKIEPELARMGIRMFLPSEEGLALRSKAKFAELAETHGISVPRGRAVTDALSIHRLHEEFTFPLMVKGQFYEAYIAYSPVEAEAIFHRISAKWGLPVVVQEFIAGEEYDVVALGDGEGGLIGAVPMRKMQLTDKGKAWGGVTINDPGMNGFVREVVSKLRWRGPCELEIMKGRDGGYYLIEINPRFPAWVYLSVGAGQNLPWAAVRLARGERVDPLPPYSVGTMFIRHSMDMIYPLSMYEAITTGGELHHKG